VKREFGIYNFEDFVRRIEEDWKKSIKSYFYDASSDVELSNKTLEEVSRSLLIKVIEKYLPKREVTEKSILTKDELETFDRVKTLLKTLQDKNKEFVSSELKYKAGEISGCTDPNSLNYNPDATIDDGSCKYKEDETTDDTDKKDTNEDTTTTDDETNVISVRLKNNLIVEGLLNYQIPGKAVLLEDGNQSFSLDITDSPKSIRVYSPGGLPFKYEFNSVIKNSDDEVIATYIYPGYEISLIEDVIIETTLKEKSSDTEEEKTTNSADGTSGSPTTPSGAGGID
jgi:DNA-directed RNA polymerase